MTSVNLRSELWIDVANAENKYRYVVERRFEDGRLVADHDINRNLGYANNEPALKGLTPSRWFRVGDEPDDGDEPEYPLKDDYFADPQRWKKVSMCKAKKYLGYKGPWPE